MSQPVDPAAAAHAVAEIHHDWVTGMVLALVAHADAATAEEFVFRLFRRSAPRHLSEVYECNTAREYAVPVRTVARAPGVVAGLFRDTSTVRLFQEVLGGIKSWLDQVMIS